MRSKIPQDYSQQGYKSSTGPSTAGSTSTSGYLNAASEPGTEGTILIGPAASFAADTEIGLDWYFSSSDFDPFNDFAQGWLVGPGAYRQELFSYTHIGSPNFDLGWQTATFSIPSAGSYHLELIVRDQDDTDYDTELYIASVQGWRSPANSPPIATNDTFSGIASTSTFGNVLANDFDADGDVLSANLMSVPLHGTLSLSFDGSFSYMPDFGWSGTDTFTYQADDGIDSSGTATVTLTVRPGVSISPDDLDASELGIDSGILNLTRTGDLSGTLVASYSVSGSAINGVDYQTLTGTVTFLSGSSTATISITPIADNLLEGNEYATISLTSSSSYGLGTYTVATITIADDPPVVSVSATGSPSESGPTGGTFTFSRSGGDTTLPLVVTYTLAGSATNGTDYDSLPGTVTFTAGATSTTLALTLKKDNLAEGSESVVLSVAASGSYSIAGSPATLSIADDPPTVTFSASGSPTEAGPSPGSFNFTRFGGDAVVFRAIEVRIIPESYPVESGEVPIECGRNRGNVLAVPYVPLPQTRV